MLSSKIITFIVNHILLLGYMIAPVKANLPSSDVDETPKEGCRNNPSAPADALWVLTPRTYYNVLAAKYYFRLEFEIMVGRSANTQAELDELKLISAFAGTLSITNAGSNSDMPIPPLYVLNCFPNGLDLLNVNCDLVFPGTAQNPSLVNHVQASVQWTDNATAILIIACITGTDCVPHYTWFVYSVYKTITPAVRSTILDVVTSFGFKKSLAVTMSF